MHIILKYLVFTFFLFFKYSFSLQELEKETIYKTSFKETEFEIYREEDSLWMPSLKWRILEKPGKFTLYLNKEIVGSFWYTKTCLKLRKKRSIKCFIRYIEIEDKFKNKGYGLFFIKYACQKLLQDNVISFYGYPFIGVEDLYLNLAKQNLLNIKFTKEVSKTNMKATCFVGPRIMSRL